MNQIESQAFRQYLLVTGNYWAFTLTDGALRMLVVLYFHQLGYSPLAIASLFLFYEFFGCVTNLVGGWLGARIGLNRTMNFGLALQVIALLMLALPSHYLTIPLVMAAQALSGIAKDLNKMSAKSSIKVLNRNQASRSSNQPLHQQDNQLYKWVAILTGSKNTLKGAGFFLGGALLTTIGFQGAVLAMAGSLALIWLFSILKLKNDLGRSTFKPKFSQIFSKSSTINTLAAARLFLFGARDIWFVVALPVFLSEVLAWNYHATGGFLAVWIIGYGAMQTIAPFFTRIRLGKNSVSNANNPQGGRATIWALLLATVPATIALCMSNEMVADPTQIETVLILGLIFFGLVFAINSSLHSYLIIHYADSEKVSMDVGFYYMANAMGRLTGTILSGWIYQYHGMAACLYASSIFILIAALFSLKLPSSKNPQKQAE